MENNYHFFRNLIKEYQNGEIDISEEQIMEKLDLAYEEETITGREYDNLLCLL